MQSEVLLSSVCRAGDYRTSTYCTLQVRTCTEIYWSGSRFSKNFRGIFHKTSCHQLTIMPERNARRSKLHRTASCCHECRKTFGTLWCLSIWPKWNQTKTKQNQISFGEFLVRCARPPKGIPKGPKKKKKKKITIDNDNIKTPKFSLFYCLLWYFLLGRLYK